MARSGQMGELGLAEALQRAATLYREGKWDGAEKLCALILQRDPQQLDAMGLLGIIAAQTQRTPQALDLLGRVAAARPRDPYALNNHANVLKELKRFDDALAAYERALLIKPDYAEAHNNRADVLQELGRLEQALESYQRALQLKPDYAGAHNNRGYVLLRLRRFEEALQSCERSLQLQPDHAEAHSNRGYALQRLGRFEEALQSCDRALELKRDYAEGHSNRGCALQGLGRFEEALQSYQRALELEPDYAEAHSNMGVWHYARNEPEAAIVSFDQAIGISPDYPWAHLNRAYAELLGGDFANGWVDHEWRWKAMPYLVDSRYPERTRWHGHEPLIGKRVVLWSEQGLGDTLQFCRYAKQVAESGATVILEVPAQLAALLAKLDGVSQLVVRGEPLPAFDYHCPLMSLPLAFRTRVSTIPARVPYLPSDRLKAEHWKEKLGPHTGFRVGLAWSGGFKLNRSELWLGVKRRDVPLKTLAPLANAAISFYSLQKGEPAESELAELKASGWQGPEVIDFTESLRDFADTAALVENLDLVISVDTSVAHLAGALAKPVWIMNRFETCWRWLLGRTDSPWYPTATLYRQQRAGDWDEVVERIRSDLFNTLQADHSMTIP